MPPALFFLSQEQSECDFSEGSQDALGALGCCWAAACFQLDWRACQSFHLLRNEPQALARSRGRQQSESHAGSFPLTSNPEVLKLIPHKDSPSLWCLFEIRLAIMTFLRCLLVKIAPCWVWKAAEGLSPTPPTRVGEMPQQSGQGDRLAWPEVLPGGRKWPLAQMAGLPRAPMTWSHCCFPGLSRWLSPGENCSHLHVKQIPWVLTGIFVKGNWSHKGTRPEH